MADGGIVVIGAGPAGVAAAVQLKRMGLSFRILEGNTVGGLLRNAYRIDNYPGFPDGITGAELVSRLRIHLQRWDIEVMDDQVRELSYHGGKRPFSLVLDHGGVMDADGIIVASGTRAVEPTGFSRWRRTVGPYFFTEIADIAPLEGGRAVVVGAGDAAFDYALSLARRNRVTILNRGRRIRALKWLVQQVMDHAGIDYRDWARIGKVEPGNGKNVRLMVVTENRREVMQCDVVVFAIGRKERTGFISATLSPVPRVLIEEGRIKFAGDVAGGFCRQTAIAAGDGVSAAMTMAEKSAGWAR